LPVNAKDRIILALDVDTQEEALSLAGRLSGHVGVFKVSLRLFAIAGPQIVGKLQEMGQVFIDLKLHDIPSTVAAAGRALTRLGCNMLTAHAAGGTVMLKELTRAVSDESRSAGRPAPTVLAVTVLTSINQRQLEEDMLISNMLVRDAAMLFAGRAKTAGVGGVVCSASEIAAVRATCGQDFKIVTSGIRPTWHGSNDQRRIDTPFEAIKRGADYVVIGRPITRAPHPVAAAHAIAEEIEYALAGFDI
jgi:orotidine-5'-phosphate decarboxylase